MNGNSVSATGSNPSTGIEIPTDTKTGTPRSPVKLLIINPNTSLTMSQGIADLINASSVFSGFDLYIHTARSGVDSINNDDDALKSAHVVLEEISPTLQSYDAVLVACYSVHPLVPMIRQRVSPSVAVNGIFEASISTAMALLPSKNECKVLSKEPLQTWGNAEGYETFGIVSTGDFWKAALTKGVMEFLGSSRYLKDADRHKFEGVETTGLSAAELHQVDHTVVAQRLREATKRLLQSKSCSVICLGCAGMAGMDSIVRGAVVEELGEEEAEHVKIIDGVNAGLEWFEGIMKTLPER